jgi:hypothetical protein
MKCSILHHGHIIVIAGEAVPAHLRNHPGDVLIECHPRK